MDKISVIVPIYNSEKTLRRCIKSIIKQTYNNLDIILIDDGSTDKSGRICDRFANIDSRIRVLHKKNGGIVSARNAGIQMISKEGYTTFCDSDDRMAIDAVEKLYKFRTSTNADVVCGNLQKFFAHGIKLKKTIPPSLSKKRCYNKEEINTEIMPSFFGITDFTGYMHTKLYKNSLLKETIEIQYPILQFQEDVLFNLLITLTAEKIAVIPDIIYYYRVGGGTSRYMPNFLEDCVSLYNFKLSVIEKHCFPEGYRYTTAVELRNESWFWLQMQFEHLQGAQNRETMIDEIKRCCNIPEIVRAVNYPKEDNSGVPGFRKMVKDKQYEKIFFLLAEQERNNCLKNKIKQLLIRI